MSLPPRWVWLPLLYSACLPTPHEIIGRPCDGAHPCGGDLVCVASLCAASVELPSLLANGGFESGELNWLPIDFTTLSVIDAPVRSGDHAMRVSQTPGTSPTVIAIAIPKGLVKGLTPGGTYCTEAWVQQGNATTSLILIMRTWTDASNYVDSDPLDPASYSKAGEDGWQKLKAKIKYDPPSTQINFRIAAKVGAPATFFLVDDARLWLDDGSGCR